MTRRCSGFPGKNDCQRTVGSKSRYWCNSCEAKRVASLDQNFKDLQAHFKRKAEGK